MTDIYDEYASDRVGPPPDANQDINKEYENQRKYLYSSVTSLKKKKNKDKEIHDRENLKIMQANQKLIEVIIPLRD